MFSMYYYKWLSCEYNKYCNITLCCVDGYQFWTLCLHVHTACLQYFSCTNCKDRRKGPFVTLHSENSQHLQTAHNVMNLM